MNKYGRLAIGLLLIGIAACGKSASPGPGAGPAGAGKPGFLGKWQMDRALTRKTNSFAARLSGGIRYVFNEDGTCIEGFGPNDSKGKWKTLKQDGAVFSLEVDVSERQAYKNVELAIIDDDHITLRYSKDSPRGDELVHLNRVGNFTADEPNRDVPILRPRITIETGFANNVHSVAISADGKCVAAHTYGDLKNLQIWDIETKGKIKEFDVKTKSGSPVALSPDGKRVAYATWDYYHAEVYVRDIASGNELHHFGDDGAARGLAFSADGKLIVVAIGTKVHGRDAATGAERFSWEADPKEITALSPLFEDEKKIASLSPSGAVIVWDMETRKPLQTFQVGPAARSLAVSRDGKWLVVDHAEKPKLWDLRAARERRTLDDASGDNKVVFLGDGKTAAYTASAGTWKGLKGDGKGVALCLENVESEKIRAFLADHFGGLGGLAATPDGNTLVSGGAHDGTLKIWSLKAVP